MKHNLTRRSALIGLTTSLFVPPAAAALVAAEQAADPMSAAERKAFHLAEYQRACEEIDPLISVWSERDYGADRIVTAHRVSGRYVGDGYYDCWAPGRQNKCVNLVRLTPDIIDGYRTFYLTAWPGLGKPFARYTEPLLEQTVCNILT